jgi:hypothetical protein
MNGLILKTEGDNKMVREENLIDQKVTYSIFKDGKFYIIENVPARVNPETGEQFFSPNTVDKIQKIILGHPKPLKTISTPVFEFS